MRKYKLDKLFDTNTDYRTRTRTAYVIKALATDDVAAVTSKIDDKDLTIFTNYVAPLRDINTNTFKPLDLKDLYLVVPPDTKFRFTGTAAKLVRAVGLLLRLDVGESLPSDYLSRFKAQHNHFFTDLIGSAVTQSGSLANGGEDTVQTMSPTTAEKYVLRHFLGSRETTAMNPAETEGDIDVMFYLDGNPLDIEESTEGYLGIPRIGLHIPPADTKVKTPFSLEDAPVEVIGDHTLLIKHRNVSGGALGGVAAAVWVQHTIAEYFKFVA